MQKLLVGFFVLVILGSRPPADTSVDEGMWLPPLIGTQISEDALAKMGCRLKASDFWSDENVSFKDAMLQIGDLSDDGARVQGYGSGSFVSKKGLVLTNHHVAFDALTRLSKPGENLIEKGYVATTMADELPCKGMAVQLTTLMEDITEQVQGGITPEMDPEARAMAISEAEKRALGAAKAAGYETAEVVEMLSGKQYWLVAYEVFRDVRLVYAPSQGIGDFGGDIDNWMWPRHSGDFTYLRVYVSPDGEHGKHAPENVPYEPQKHLEVSTKGYSAGDFCFIMGYPAETSRYRSSFGLEMWETVELPQNITQLKTMASRLEEQTKRSESAAIRVASDLKSINNTLKNFEGLREGFKRLDLVNQRRAEEDRFMAWVAEDPARVQRWGDVIPTIRKFQDQLHRDRKPTELLQKALRSDTILTAYWLVSNREKMPPGRYQIMGNTLKKGLEATTIEAQRAALTGLLGPFASLGADERPSALAPLAEHFADVDAWVASLLPKPVDAERLDAALGLTSETLSASDDALDKVGAALLGAQAEILSHIEEFARLAPGLSQRLIDGMSAFRGRPAYPDANFTLRMTYGKVGGFSPKDGIDYRHFTTIEGAVAKATDTYPFAAPKELIEKSKARDFGRWADAKSGTLVTCFLSDTDITGGNSGSPIMNGDGKLIGLAFDGVWESMTSDYEFMPSITRTISVDIRYVLWCTEKLAGLTRLIDEMSIDS